MSETYILKRNIAAILVAMFFCAASLSAQPKHMSLYFENRVRQDIVHPDSTTFGYYALLQIDSTYMNALGQPYTVTNFKYYVSNIKLTDTNGKVFVHKDGYYLINQEDSASHHIELNDVPPGYYGKISFTIGVDSLHNCSGAQSGALDPINGMFWTWNSGYIFMKLEGKSPASRQPGHTYEYHIGGYKAPANCIRNVTLNIMERDAYMNDDIPAGIKPEDTLIMDGISIRANVSAILSSHTRLDFSKMSSITDFHNAEIVADNYKDMFFMIGVSYDKK